MVWRKASGIVSIWDEASVHTASQKRASKQTKATKTSCLNVVDMNEPDGALNFPQRAVVTRVTARFA